MAIIVKQSRSLSASAACPPTTRTQRRAAHHSLEHSDPQINNYFSLTIAEIAPTRTATGMPIVTNVNGPAELLRNDATPGRRARLALDGRG